MRIARVSNNTVTAIAEQECQQVETRKARIAAKAERIADLAAERLTDHTCNRFARRAILPFTIREAYQRRDDPQCVLEVKRS